MSRRPPLPIVLAGLLCLAIAGPALAGGSADPLDIMGAGMTVVQPLIHGGPAYGALGISLSLEPLVPPDTATGELLIANGGISGGIALTLADLSGQRMKLGLAVIPGDLAAIVKYDLSKPLGDRSLASGEADPLEPNWQISVCPGLHETTIALRCDVVLR